MISVKNIVIKIHFGTDFSRLNIFTSVVCILHERLGKHTNENAIKLSPKYLCAFRSFYAVYIALRLITSRHLGNIPS